MSAPEDFYAPLDSDAILQPREYAGFQLPPEVIYVPVGEGEKQ